MAVSLETSTRCEIQLTSQTSSFSRAFHFAREIAFGVLAILGCIFVQCLILTWLLFTKVQIRLVLLQAKLLRRMYLRTSEKRPLTDGKKVPNIIGDSDPYICIDFC